MQYRVEISAQASRDLDRIFRFINGENSLAAARWFNGLHLALASLTEMPYRFPVTRDKPPTRHLLYGAKPHVYRALYTIDETREVVSILTIRHGARAPLRPDQGESPP